MYKLAMREMSQHDFGFNLCLRINWVSIYGSSLHAENSACGQIYFLYYFEECFTHRCLKMVITRLDGSLTL